MAYLRGRNILVYRLSALGDVAMTVPAVYSVARAYPEHSFYMVTSATCKQLFVAPPANLVVYGVESPVSTIRLLKQLNSLPIDMVADLHNVFRSWVVGTLFLMKGKKVRMLDKERGKRGAILGEEKATATPFIQRYFDVFRRLGLPCEPTFTSLFAAKPPLPLNLRKTIVGNGSERCNGQWIGIAPFARYQNKTYPLEQMREVVRLLAAEPGTLIFLFGGRGQQATALSGWESLSPDIQSVAGRFSLREELSLMAHLDLMLSMDSANMHLASLVGTRVISVWGSTTPACGFLGWGQQEADALCLHLSCQPCTIGGSNNCRKGTYDCLRNLTPSDIVHKISTLNLYP